MSNGLTTNFWRFPTITIPSWVEDIEEMLPTTNIINGLSVSEDAKNIYVEAAVPGLEAKDVDVTFQKGLLTIRGERKEEEKGKTYQRKATSSFVYKVTPGDVDPTAEPEASYSNGMMKITFAKAPEGKPLKIKVKKG
jgi:HSP20 family protein